MTKDLVAFDFPAKLGADVEMHLFSKDELAFNMGFRSEFVSINHWPARLKDWLEDHAYFRNNKFSGYVTLPIC